MPPTLLKNASSSALQSIGSAIVLFLLYRYLLRQLGSDQLGIWAVVLASTSIARLSELGVAGAALKFVAQQVKMQRRDVAGQAVQTAAISVAVLIAAALLCAFPLLQASLGWVLPGHASRLALEILPWALGSLWTNLVAGVILSALDGCRRSDIKNAILISCNLFYLIAAFALVSGKGLRGLAEAQLWQSGLILGLGWVAIKKELSVPQWFPIVWDRSLFNQMWRYAINFQLANLAAMLFDPAVKYLLTRFGGLSEVAFYEMANQLIAKSRAILISAFQAIVPVIARVDEADVNRMAELYLKSFRIYAYLSLPYFLLIGAAVPLISLLWIGRIERDFMLFGLILGFGWLLAGIGVPGYFHNIGTGRLKINTWTHLLTAAVLLPVGLLMGACLQGIGVVIAAMISIMLANLVLTIEIHRRLGLRLGILITREHSGQIKWVAAVALASLTLYLSSLHKYGSSIAAPLAVIAATLLYGFREWRSAYGRKLLGELRHE